MQHLDELTVRSEPKKASNTQAIALSGAPPPYVKERPMVPKAQKQGSREKKTLQPEQTNEMLLSASEKNRKPREYGDWLKILPNPKSKPEFKKTTLEGFTVDAAERKPYETQYIDVIEFAGEERKKTENTIISDKGFEIQAKPNAKADKSNLKLQHSRFSLLAEKEVKPRVTDAFKTPSKKKDKGADSFKGKNKQTKYEMYSYSSSMYKYSDLVNDLIEEDKASEKEEKIRPEAEKISAFTLDGKPTVAKNEISNAESIQILKKKEKPLLAPTKTAAVEVKAMKKQPPKFEISKTQPITAEAQAAETKESATEP